LCLDAGSARAAADLAHDEVMRAVLDDEADRARIAAALRDRVGDVLVALGYSASRVADGRADAASLAEPVRAALTAFRHAQRELRAHALEGGLRAALAELAAGRHGDRLDDGLPMVHVQVEATDPALDLLPPAIAVTVQRVAETSLRGATGTIRLCAAIDGSMVKLYVDSADIAYDAGELGRWERRVRALGGHLWPGPDGVELSLPAASEGSHDDRPDL
jgi:signal transduction histidine kinase